MKISARISPLPPPDIARIKNNPRITMPIFGNGDIDSPEKALEYKNKYGLERK